ncbi:MAG: DUF6470 family protein [Clostridia bacterium]
MVNQSLLNITKTHVDYRLNIQNAELRTSNAATKPSANVKTTMASLSIVENTPCTYRADSYNARHALGFSKTGDFIRESADEARQHVLNFMREKTLQNISLGQIQDGVEIQDIVTNRIVNEARMPSATLIQCPKVDIEWSEPSLRFQYNPPQLQYDWNTYETGLEYIPGDASLEVTQLPDVQIEYMGKPMYFPRSYSG